MGFWTRDSIRQVIADEFGGRKIIAVSDCEPYTRFHSGNAVEWKKPASGLISAVDEIMRAARGLWIAQEGSKTDRATQDARDYLRVPPNEPSYTVRRLRLPSELNRDYYYGLANETIWRACHLAFRRPQLIERCWDSYRRVNEIFAEAVLEEAEDRSAVVLVQDHHLALLPSMLKERNPKLRVALFWHIPWPSPETVRILPWRQELLRGLLGADLIGFHLQKHCTNFLATVAQNVATRVDAFGACETFDGHLTTIRPFPISIDFEDHSLRAASKEVDHRMRGWLHELGSTPEILGIGIDRIDYTKGIPERLAALDRLLEEHPEHLGRLVFVQAGAPSRSAIAESQTLQDDIAAQVSQINARWAMRDWKPIVFVPSQLDRDTLIALHLLADFCVVSSLHDGMNLVAKEFVASRIDEDGVLVLSEFAGAARELTDALVINPFCIGEIAAAIHTAIGMPPEERRRRMMAMRQAVAANNVFRWGSELLTALAETASRDAVDHASQVLQD